MVRYLHIPRSFMVGKFLISTLAINLLRLPIILPVFSSSRCMQPITDQFNANSYQLLMLSSCSRASSDAPSVKKVLYDFEDVVDL